MQQQARSKVRVCSRAAALLAVPISLLSFSDAGAQVLIEPPSEPLRMGIDLFRCPDQGSPDEIMVCGRRDDQVRHRLPLREQGGSASGPVRGEVPRASAEANPTAPCGIHEGERRCGKAEMRQYGYYSSNNPLVAAREALEDAVGPD